MRRKPVEDLRVPLNCLIAPATKEWLTGIQNETGESQGEIIDRFAQGGAFVSDWPVLPRVAARKPGRREIEAAKRLRADATALAVERSDIDYSDLDSTPTTHVAHLDAVAPASGVGKASLDTWRESRKPLLKPRDR